MERAILPNENYARVYIRNIKKKVYLCSKKMLYLILKL